MTMLFDRVLPDVLATRAGLTPDRIFLQPVDEQPVTFRETYMRACAVGNGLVELGVQRGDSVVIMADSSTDSICTWLGIQLAAAVEVAINTGYRGDSLTHALQNSRAKLAFVDAALVPRLAEVRESLTHLETIVVYDAVVPDERPLLGSLAVLSFAESLGYDGTQPDRPVHPRDLASVVYTSGTTGPAKGVMMPHGQISLFARLGIEGADMSEDDAHYCFIPLYHVAGKFMAMYASLITGGRVIVDTEFSAEQWLPRVRQYGATLSHVHGPLVEMIYSQPPTPEDADNQVTRIVASPFPAKIAHEFEERFGLRGIETWGMTEVTVPVWQPHDQPLQPGCCGLVREEYFDLRIVDPETDEEVVRGATGELVLRPRQPWTIMQGYLRDPAATADTWRNLWFHTGDHGFMDDGDRVYFMDRAKERIRRRAENISSYDIEAAALKEAQVRECAAVGVPSEFEGDDDVLLYVVPEAGVALEPAALTRRLATQLPHFMVPRYLRFVTELPRTPTGKIQKGLLRDAGMDTDTWDRKAAGISLRDLTATEVHPS